MGMTAADSQLAPAHNLACSGPLLSRRMNVCQSSRSRRLGRHARDSTVPGTASIPSFSVSPGSFMKAGNT